MKIVIRWKPLVLGALCLCGLLLRLYNLNWDQGNSLQPDEREILFQVTTLCWPTSWAQFLDPTKSPLNPHFFAYGSFPLYLLALIGAILHYDYSSPTAFVNLTLIGRAISALFDTATILLTAWLGLRLTLDDLPGRPRSWNVALFAGSLVVFTPLQLQLSHFYAVDTMLVFFVMLTILACVILVDTDAPMRWALVAGLGYGLALGTKVSAAPLAVPLLVAIGLRWYKKRSFLSAICPLVLAITISLVVFLLVEPYALLDFNNFRILTSQEGDIARGTFDVPYTRQFAGTIPYLYEGQNMILWGMGVTLGCSSVIALLWFIWRVLRRDAGSWLVVLSWILVYSAIVGSFYTKYMRYMLPVYPLLTLMAAVGVLAVVRGLPTPPTDQLQRVPTLSGNLLPAPRFIGRKRTDPLQRVRERGGDLSPVQKCYTHLALAASLLVIVLGGTIFQGLALLNVYSQPNTRLQASLWMYHHLRPGSVLTYEQWDDPLPLVLNGYDLSMFTEAEYKTTSGQLASGLDLYGDDTVQKAQQLASLLSAVDAITMTTDRLDKSIPRLSQRYPLTIHYYQLLFSGQLGFHLAAQFDNYPHLFGITLNDRGADESYSVFDHPTCRVFVRDTPYPYTSDQLFHKLLEGVHLSSVSTAGVVKAS
ncbi:MAG TPA: glycosyltransferase family 39 protein [Ktedonobacteraceae bacterium]|nr:glycosyltransferase family 39 protein [Ktedonobacteraceae bacterium]